MRRVIPPVILAFFVSALLPGAGRAGDDIPVPCDCFDDSPKNVLIIVADDVGVDKIGCYAEGVDPPSTPVIDTLKRNGILFRNAWANPVCSPTRATILTGRYSFRTGVGTAIPGGDPLRFAEITLPEALDTVTGGAYAHTAIGKWHLGGSTANVIASRNPNRHGFAGFRGSIVGALFPPSDFYSWLKTVDGRNLYSNTYATTDNVNDALSFIEAQTGRWMCYLSFNAAHTPFHTPPADLHDQPLPDVDPCEDPVPFFNAMVQAMDREIGRLILSMDPEVRRETTIIFVGDNGTTGSVSIPPFLPSHAKGSLYEGGINVPLIIAGAGVARPGEECAALVNTSDLFATVIELAGGTVEEAVPDGRPLDTVSLVPYLRDPDQASLRQTVYAEVFDDAPVPLRGSEGEDCLLGGAVLARGRTMRNTTFKLIQHEDGSEELYNLESDTFEQFNLLDLPSLPPLAQANYDALTAAIADLLGS